MQTKMERNDIDEVLNDFLGVSEVRGFEDSGNEYIPSFGRDSDSCNESSGDGDEENYEDEYNNLNRSINNLLGVSEEGMLQDESVHSSSDVSEDELFQDESINHVNSSVSITWDCFKINL